MKRSWTVPSGWGALLLLFAAVQLIFRPRGVELVMLGGAGAVMVALGALAFLGEQHDLPPKPDTSTARVVPWTSAASATLGTGLGIFVLGWEIGSWLIGIGAAVVLLGIGGLIREWRAVRR